MRAQAPRRSRAARRRSRATSLRWPYTWSVSIRFANTRPRAQLARAAPRRCRARARWWRRVGHAHADAGEQVVDLADRRAPPRRRPAAPAGSCAPAACSAKSRRPVGARERSRRAGERPRDHAPDGVLAAHRRPRRRARPVELLGRDALDVRRQLQDRVLGGVEDQRAGAQVLGAELLDRREPVVGPVADHLVAGRLARARATHLRREARAGRWAARRSSTTPISSQWPLIESLPGPSGCRRPWIAGSALGGTPRRGRIEPSPSACSVGSSSPPTASARCAERVRALVAVGRGVRQRADAARVDHQHERPPRGDGAVAFIAGCLPCAHVGRYGATRAGAR